MNKWIVVRLVASFFISAIFVVAFLIMESKDPGGDRTARIMALLALITAANGGWWAGARRKP